MPSAQALRAFRASAPYRALDDAFSHAGGCEDRLARSAARLLGDDAWLAALIAVMAEALAADPYGDPPLRVSRDPVRVGAILFENDVVSTTAAIVSATAHRALPSPTTVVVPGRLAIVRYVRANGARLRLWSAEPAGADFSAAEAPPCIALGGLSLADGAVLRLDGRTHGHVLEPGAGDVVTLTVTIHTGEAPFMREYAIDGGALLRVAALDARASRTQMLLAYLRTGRRADAAACFETATRDEAFSVRWSAMREWLALDVRAALPRLRDMAKADSNAEVRDAASATLAMLDARAARARAAA